MTPTEIRAKLEHYTVCHDCTIERAFITEGLRVVDERENHKGLFVSTKLHFELGLIAAILERAAGKNKEEDK